MRLPENLRFDSLAVHGGQVPDPATGSRAVPIYQTTAYQFRDAEHAANLFGLKEEGNIYSRLSNPTTDVFERRMAALEGGIGALALSSGHAAIVAAILNICEAGDEIVSSSSLYGGTHNLFAHNLPRMGVKAAFVDAGDTRNFAAAITDRTKALYAEVVGNPKADILDIEAAANIAHARGIPLIVDATFATPYLCRPIDFGADIVLHSATKFIGGHGAAMGGVIIDGGKFDWNNGKFPLLSAPDPSYHGLNYAEDIGAAAYVTRLRTQMIRDLGACLSPFNSFLFLIGLETLPLRMRRHAENARKAAEYLSRHEAVRWVSYAGLKTHPDHEKACKYLPEGPGAVFTFGIRGGLDAGKKFINSLNLFSLLANVGDAKSLVIHPASTTHAQLTPEQLKSAGVEEDLIRLSIGIEDIDDILEDLDQALRKSQRKS